MQNKVEQVWKSEEIYHLFICYFWGTGDRQLKQRWVWNGKVCIVDCLQSYSLNWKLLCWCRPWWNNLVKISRISLQDVLPFRETDHLSFFLDVHASSFSRDSFPKLNWRLRFSIMRKKNWRARNIYKKKKHPILK